MATKFVIQPEPLPGYRLIERLGRGGYGEVWKAEAPGGLFKAIKFVYGDLDSGAGEDNHGAEQELKALNRVKAIRHPYILSLERIDICDGQLIIVMELADRSLWDRFHECRNQKLPGIPRAELLGYLEEAAEGLDLMNIEYGIQHLDVKPQNLFLVHSHIKVADFGLAKDFAGAKERITGGVTPVYAAPETFDGWVTRFSDQYSLAIVYQELLTGIRPYTGMTARQLLMQHVEGSPDLAPLPAGDKPVILRALSKNPDERFPSCQEFIQALLDAEATEGTSQSAAQKAGRDFGGFSDNGVPLTMQPGQNFQHLRRVAPPASTPISPATKFAPARGLPALVTVSKERAPTPAAAITLQRPVAFETGKVHKLGLAPPERAGAGILFPAIFIGIGQTGLEVLQRLRLHIYDRFGKPSLPHLRWLFIDTDLTAVHRAAGDSHRDAFDPSEVLPVPLRRPAHYLKKESLPPLDPWLPAELLYRIPRNPMTEGSRALGRLALIDNYRQVSQRLRDEIESLLSDEALAEADRVTGLGLRSNRPRVYISCSLAGGTGSGMFLDLAYVIRHELRGMGYARPMLTGVFLVPAQDGNPSRTLPVANTFAALTELNHMSLAATRYEVRFENRQAPIVDTERPFDRCLIVSRRQKAEGNPNSTMDLAAGSIYQEVLTGVGASAEDGRVAYFEENPTPGLVLQSANIYRLTWPRQRLVLVAARRFSHRLLDRWTSKETKVPTEQVQQWVEEQWMRRHLAPHAITEAVVASALEKLGDRPESLIESALQRVTLPGLDPVTDPAVACDVLSELVKLVGKPGAEEEFHPGAVTQAFDERSTSLGKETEMRLVELAIHFIEQPMMRLAGAEEAIRQFTAKLDHEKQQCEKACAELEPESQQGFTQLLSALGSVGRSSLPGIQARRSVTPEIVTLLRSWATRRYRYVLARAVGAVYRQLLGNAPEYLREVNFCRHQLGELRQQLAKVSKPGVGDSLTHDHPILPLGCRTLEEAVDQLIVQIEDKELLEFEETLQVQLRRQCRALVTVCLNLNDYGSRFTEMLWEQSREFMSTKLLEMSAPEVFLLNRPDEQSAHREILRALDESAPAPISNVPRPAARSVVLGVPGDEAGQEFREVAREALTGIKVLASKSEREIVFYQEQYGIHPTELPQLGPLAADVAKHFKQERMSPFSRTDVTWLTVGKKDE